MIPRTKIEGTIMLDERVMISMVFDRNISCESKISITGEVSSAEFQAGNLLANILRCLYHGLDIDNQFNPTKRVNIDDLTMVKCRWMRSGKLRIVEDPAPKRFLHADDIPEALSRHRNFTCSRKLYDSLPKIRYKTLDALFESKESESDRIARMTRGIVPVKAEVATNG